jgi:hypothetical protein
MREVLSLFMFGIGAVLFVMFFTLCRPDIVTEVAASSKPVSVQLHPFRMSQSSDP